MLLVLIIGDADSIKCVSVVDGLTYCAMLSHGFHFHRAPLRRFFTLFPFRPLTLFSAHRSPVKHLTYWHRQHRSKTRLPVLFIHGIGIGLYPYANFLGELAKELATDEVGVIALEIMPVSFRLTHSVLDKDAMTQEILKIIRHHGWTKFVLVSHSYGSTIATHLIKSPLATSYVGPVVFIDPISFLLHLPDVTYNFTARQPERANEYQLWYFASKDLGVAHTLARRFSWNANIIWKEDLGDRNVTVVLCGQDLIVDAEAVGQYLLGSSEGAGNRTDAWKRKPWVGSGLEVLWYDQLDHAQVFDREETRRPVIQAVSVYANSSL